ncbi:MAG: hypothetical protein K6T91_05455 [Firmicutes bacterium]|nr:hypothetical protein [Bacillota bacterium]
MGKRQLLLVAYLDKAFPLDLLKEEQNKIADALLTAETRLEELTATNDEVEETIYLAISMLLIAMKLTKKGSPKTKRMFNQALFKKIYLNGKKASNHEFAEPFDVIFFSKFK